MEADSESDLLAGFRTPIGAIHHPQKIGFYPAHTRVTELGAEISMVHGKHADGWTVSLVDDDRLGIKLGEDMPARLWSKGELIEIVFGQRNHLLARNAIFGKG